MKKENLPVSAVVGRFPPPVDGQTLATKRLADMLEGSSRVLRCNTEPAGSRATERAPRTAGRLLHFIRLRTHLKNRLGEANPDTILWASISPDPAGHFRDLLCVLPAFPGSARVFAIVHRGNFEKLFTSPVTRVTGRRLVSRVDGFVFLSRHLSDRCAQWIPANQRFVIPNTIDRDVLFTAAELDEKRQEAGQTGHFRVLYLSNMIASKGFFDVLEAVIMLRGQNVHAEFAGAWESESDRTAFTQMVEKAGIAEKVTVHGPVHDRRTIRTLLKNADALVLPTYYPNEAQPLVLLEAMNAGVPVISTRHGAIPEIIEEDRSGYFVPQKSPDAIAEAVTRLLEPGTWQRISKGARQRFEECFSPSAVRGQWMNLIRSEAGVP